MIRKITVLFVVWASCLSIYGSQRERLSAFIHSLEVNGLYREAVTEYRKYLFFNDLKREERGKIWLRMAVCFREMNREAEMMDAFGHSHKLLVNTDFLGKLYEEISVYFLSRGKTDWARFYLNKTDNQQPVQQIMLYRLLSYLMDEDWPDFFSLLTQAGYGQPVIERIEEIAAKIRRCNRKFRWLNILDKIVPGISYGYTGNGFMAGESILFHSFLILQIFSEPSVPGKLIYGFALIRLYSRTTAHGRDKVIKKRNRKKMDLEKKIFDQLVTHLQS